VDKARIRLYIAPGSLSFRSDSMVVVSVASGSERGQQVGERMERLQNSGTVLGCRYQRR